MNLYEITPPTEEPVSVEYVKQWTRIDISDDDNLIADMITSARMMCEASCWRRFITSTFMYTTERFPYAVPVAYFPFFTLERLPNQLWGRIYLPYAPLQEVTSITYTVPETGTVATLDPSQYRVQSSGRLQGLVTPAYGLLFPASRYEIESVSITYTVGYGDATTVPTCAKHAIAMLTAHMYQHREATVEGTLTEMPLGVERLLDPIRYGGYL